jgi:chromatin structure-remodeling complex subunit RSC1/2
MVYRLTKGKPGLTVCWYYRPEQTVHPVHRIFWENEVFKTSHFADHTLDDVIEKIALQFTARHIRGRPRPPFWYPGWPLYVCDSRYNDRERCFVKIKNWSSCVPEEVRKRGDWMPLYPFERMVYPHRNSSPFVRVKGIKGTGFLGDSVERGEGEKIEGGGTGRKRARKGGSGTSSLTDSYGPTKGLYIGSAQYAPPSESRPQQQVIPAQYTQQQQVQQANFAHYAQVPPVPVFEDRSILQAAGGSAIAGTPYFEKLPTEISKCFRACVCMQC